MNLSRRSFIASAALLAACGGGTGDVRKPRLVLFGESHASRWCEFNANTLTRWEWINRGIGGENTPDGLKRLPEALNLRPDLLILWEGGNDATRWGNLNEDAYRSMLQLISRSGVRSMALTTPPILRSVSEGQAAHRVAEAQRRLCAAEGVELFDVQPLIDQSLMLPDLLHLNAAGYQLLSTRLGWI